MEKEKADRDGGARREKKGSQNTKEDIDEKKKTSWYKRDV